MTACGEGQFSGSPPPPGPARVCRGEGWSMQLSVAVARRGGGGDWSTGSTPGGEGRGSEDVICAMFFQMANHPHFACIRLQTFVAKY